MRLSLLEQFRQLHQICQVLHNPVDCTVQPDGSCLTRKPYGRPISLASGLAVTRRGMLVGMFDHRDAGKGHAILTALMVSGLEDGVTVSMGFVSMRAGQKDYFFQQDRSIHQPPWEDNELVYSLEQA